MKSVKTYWANVYVGLRRGYGGDQHWRREARDICQTYCDKVGLCVTVTPTHFIYKDGVERGVIIGLINYPRFPSTKANIKNHAIQIATILGKRFMQYRVSIVMPDETIMIDVANGAGHDKDDTERKSPHPHSKENRNETVKTNREKMLVFC